MALKRINNRIDVDELGHTARRGVARQNRPSVTHLAPRSSDEHLDSEESELAGVGLVRLPAEGLPDSFWEMPAPQVSFEDAVAAVTSERGED